MAGTGGTKTLSLVGQNADARFYVQRAAVHPGPVLVLGSGDGRIAWELAGHVERVLAVDPSAVMVEAADQLRDGAEPRVAARTSFVQADLRSLRLPERFALVAAPRNALGLMETPEDLEAMLATVRHHLLAGGAFLFDMLNPTAPRGQGRAQDAGPTEPVSAPHAVFLPHLRERRRSTSSDGKAAGGIRRLRLRQFSPEEVDAALVRSGLVALERYGDFQGKPFELDGPLQVVVASSGEP